MHYNEDVKVNTQKNKSYCSTDPVVKYVNSHSLRLHPAQEKLIQATMQCPDQNYLSSTDQLQLLANLCKYMGYQKAIDLGTFTGYSALTLALALPPGGRVLTCDVSDKYTSMGQTIWQEAGVADKIELVIGPATETLQRLIETGEGNQYDFVYVDADKVNYDAYYELSLQLLREGGLMAFDNVLWGGAVVDPSKADCITAAIRTFNEKLAKDDRVDLSMLTIGDGLTLAFKK